jgi:hypothetical protein
MKITSLTIVTNPKDWANGDTLLAFFDVEYAGIQMRDAMLIKGARTGQIIANAPRGENRDGERAIRIVDHEIKEAMTAAAHSVFVAMGGVDAASSN